jgi:hypothetical protein
MVVFGGCSFIEILICNIFLVWNMNTIIIYHTLALISEITGKFQKIKDYLFATTLFPASMFVGTSFWIIYAIDRELIYPKIIDEFLPRFCSMIFHEI